MGDTVLRLACAALSLALACRTTPTSAPPMAGPGCRDIAKRAQRVIAEAPARTRDDATRFYAEAIDLCQEPGLAQRARTCLARAEDLAAARRCPSLPATADTVSGDGDSDVDPPSCETIVAHALRVLRRGPDAPVSPAERAEEEQLFMRDCAAASAQGRRCAIRAVTVDAIDECLTLPADDELDEGATDHLPDVDPD